MCPVNYNLNFSRMRTSSIKPFMNLKAALAFSFYIKQFHARVNINFTITSHISTMICLGIKMLLWE